MALKHCSRHLCQTQKTYLKTGSRSLLEKKIIFEHSNQHFFLFVSIFLAYNGFSKKQVLFRNKYFVGNLFFKLSAEMIYVHIERNFNFTWKCSKGLVHIWWEESPYNSNKKVLNKLLILVFWKIRGNTLLLPL